MAGDRSPEGGSPGRASGAVAAAAQDQSALRVSVAIPCSSAEALAHGLLAAVIGDPACGEVLIVVNGGPRPDPPPGEPKVRVLWLERAGLSAAKNLALAEAACDVVAFLDDDTVPDPGWCTALAEAFARLSSAVVVGGPIRLAAGVGSPSLGPEGRAFLGELDLGETETRCSPWRYPYGGNSAVRRGPALSGGGFDETLGYAAGRLVPNEEMDLYRRLEAAGGEVWYVPSAGVEHRVAPARTAFRYLARRAYWQGVADAVTRRRHPDHPLPPAGLRVRRAVRAAAGALRHGLAGRRAVASDRALVFLRLLGSLSGRGPRA